MVFAFRQCLGQRPGISQVNIIEGRAFFRADCFFRFASFAKVLHATFLCKAAPVMSERSVREAPAAMTVPMLVLAMLCVVFGVFAAAIPLRWLVFPVVPAQLTGIWWAGSATVLILTAVATGAVVYALALAHRKLRRCETYVGGERMDQVVARDQTAAPSRHIEVTGVDFYRTIEQLPGLSRIYALVRMQALDVYHLGTVCGSYVIGLLRSAHSGTLPVYLTWFLVGLLVVLHFMSPPGALR